MKRSATGFTPEGPLFKSPCVQTNNIPFLPDELISRIMISDFEANNRTFFYLVSKKWIKIFNCDLIPQLLQSQKINLSSIPFIRNLPFLKEKNQLQNSFSFRLNTYIEFLNGELSYEDVNATLNFPFKTTEKIKKIIEKPSPCIYSLINDEFHAITPNNLAVIQNNITNLQCKIFNKFPSSFQFPNLRELNIETNIDLDLNSLEKLEKLTVYLNIFDFRLNYTDIKIDQLTHLNELKIESVVKIHGDIAPLPLSSNFRLPKSLKVVNFVNLLLSPNRFKAEGRTINLDRVIDLSGKIYNQNLQIIK